PRRRWPPSEKRSGRRTGARRTSSEPPVDEPGLGAGPGVEAVARPEQPEAFTSLVLDLEIVPDGPHLGVAPAPLAVDPLRTIGPPNASPHAAPRKMGRGIVGQEGHGLDRLGRRKETHRPRP